MIRIAGAIFAAGSSRAQPAVLLRADDGGLQLEFADGRSPEPVRVESLSDPLGHVPRKLSLSDGAVFEVAWDAPLAALGVERPSAFSRIASLERNLKAVAFATLVAVLAAGGFWRWGVPVLARAAAAATPQSVMSAMDRGTLDAADRLLLRPSGLPAERQGEIRRLFDRLVENAHLTDARPDLLFRDAPSIGANAFALPGGSVVLTDGLVAAARSDAEIAGVLAHEIGHVEGRHSLRNFYGALGVGAALSLIGGGPGNLIDSVVAQAGALQTLAYTRDFELEADRRSVTLMRAIGEDPAAFMALLERIAGAGDASAGEALLATHPGLKDRREAVRGQLGADAAAIPK